MNTRKVMSSLMVLILVLGLVVIPTNIKATTSVSTENGDFYYIPSDISFPSGAKISFKKNCTNPVIVRYKQSDLVDLQKINDIIPEFIARGTTATISEGGLYRLVCDDKTPPLVAINEVDKIQIAKLYQGALYLDVADKESGIDLSKSNIKVNGVSAKFSLVNSPYGNIKINISEIGAPQTIEYTIYNGAGLSKSFAGTISAVLHLPESSLIASKITDSKIKISLNSSMADYQINYAEITLFSTKNEPVKKIKVSIEEDKKSIIIDLDTLPNNYYIEKLSVDVYTKTNQYVGTIQKKLNENKDLWSAATINVAGEKVTGTIKNISNPKGLPLVETQIFLNKKYSILKNSNNENVISEDYKPIGMVTKKYDKPTKIDTTPISLDFDLKNTSYLGLSGKYSVSMWPISCSDPFCPKDEIVLKEFTYSTPKTSTTTAKYSIVADKDWTTITAASGYKISGIKINNSPEYIVLNDTQHASIVTNKVKIPNYFYDAIEVLTKQSSEVPAPTPVPTPTPTPVPTPIPVPTPPPVEPPKTSTTITLQIGNKTMYVNGKAVYLDSAPILQNARTLLPIRAIAEALGAKVDWDEAQQKVTIQDSKTKIEMWINKPTAIVNGKTVYIDPANYKVVPILVNGRTMLPVRFISESLGAQVEWNEAQQKVTITK